MTKVQKKTFLLVSWNLKNNIDQIALLGLESVWHTQSSHKSYLVLFLFGSEQFEFWHILCPYHCVMITPNKLPIREGVKKTIESVII